LGELLILGERFLGDPLVINGVVDEIREMAVRWE